MGTQFTATWHQASEFCERIHMTLVTIRSREENERIFKYIREASKGYQYWTGGSRLVDGYNWLWLAYGETIDYTNWGAGEPGNINEKCLQLWWRRNSLEWNDRHCDTRFYFICERSKSLPGVGGTF
nr:perlucin-like protein [Leptinotarsa decemlineata]